MNIRFALAALLCAFVIGDSRAQVMVDSEPCTVSDQQYIHPGVSGSDRFVWWWCTTRFNRYWTRSLDPLFPPTPLTIDMSKEAQAASPAGFLLRGPRIAWDDPEYAGVDRAIEGLVAADINPPPVPAWRVQTNGKSATRPGYTISEGKRSSTAAAERVPVGVACGCRESAGRAIEGKSVYCLVPGTQTPLLGALCTSGEPTATIPPPPEPPKPPPVVQPPAAGPGLTQPTAGAGSKKSVSL